MEQIGNNRTNLSKLDVLGTDLVFVRFSEDVGLGCRGGTRRMPTEVATFREPSVNYCEELDMRLKVSLCTKESSETIPFYSFDSAHLQRPGPSPRSVQRHNL